jgi:predicted RNA methylase
LTFAPDPALSYWPTPSEVADHLVYRLLDPWHGDGGPGADGVSPPVRVLEPSAGEGHLLRAIREHLPRAAVTAVEPSAVRAAVLRASGLADVVVESTLEDYLAGATLDAGWQPYDLVVMNPPFTLDGRPEAWAEHFLAVANTPGLLSEPGKIGAVVPRVVMTGKSKLVRQVRAVLGEHLGHYRGHPADGLRPAVEPSDSYRCGEIDTCDKGAFAPVGAGVSTALLWAWDLPAEASDDAR